jgi:hypothetical protein
MRPIRRLQASAMRCSSCAFHACRKPCFCAALALAYLIVWVLSPPLAYGTTWRVLAVLAMLLWLALDTLAPRSVLLRPNWPVLGTVVFVIYTAFIEWLVPDSPRSTASFPSGSCCSSCLVGESHRRGRSDEAQFCFWVILLVLPVWSITTLWGINTLRGMSPARSVPDSSEEARDLGRLQGIGGYGYVYTWYFACPSWLIWRSVPARGGQAHKCGGRTDCSASSSGATSCSLQRSC